MNRLFFICVLISLLNAGATTPPKKKYKTKCIAINLKGQICRKPVENIGYQCEFHRRFIYELKIYRWYKVKAMLAQGIKNPDEMLICLNQNDTLNYTIEEVHKHISAK